MIVGKQPKIFLPIYHLWKIITVKMLHRYRKSKNQMKLFSIVYTNELNNKTIQIDVHTKAKAKNNDD